MLVQKIFSHTIYDQTTNGRFVNRPYKTTKVSDNIDDGGSKPPPCEKIVYWSYYETGYACGGSKPPPYGVIVRQVMWVPPSVEGGGTRQRDGGRAVKDGFVGAEYARAVTESEAKNLARMHGQFIIANIKNIAFSIDNSH